FMADAPAVTQAHLRLAPDENALITEAPRLEETRALEKKSIRRPQVKMARLSGKRSDRQPGDLLDSRRLIVIAGRAARGLVGVGPGRIGIDATEAPAGSDEVFQVANGAAGLCRRLRARLLPGQAQHGHGGQPGQVLFGSGLPDVLLEDLPG